MYIAYKINIDGTLSNKEHLNNNIELDAWLWRAYDNGVPTVRVQSDKTDQFAIFTDNGEQYVKL